MFVLVVIVNMQSNKSEVQQALATGTGKKVKILVFAKDTKADETKAAGTDYLGVDEYLNKIQNEGC